MNTFSTNARYVIDFVAEGMKAKLSVKSFSVVFVKKCYDLARANINNIQVDIIKQQQATRFSGR